MCQLLFIHHFLYPVQDFNDRWELIPVKYHRPVFSKSMKHAITTNKSMECTQIPVLWLLCKNSRIISLTRTTMSAWKNDVLNTTRWLQTLQHRHLFNQTQGLYKWFLENGRYYSMHAVWCHPLPGRCVSAVFIDLHI